MIFLLTIYLSLAVFDAAYTVHMLERHGIGIEMNPLIQALSRRFGIRRGTWLGVMVPTLLFGAIGYFVLPAVLDLLLPLRSVLCGMQLARLKDTWLFQRKINSF